MLIDTPIDIQHIVTTKIYEKTPEHKKTHLID